MTRSVRSPVPVLIGLGAAVATLSWQPAPASTAGVGASAEQAPRVVAEHTCPAVPVPVTRRSVAAVAVADSDAGPQAGDASGAAGSLTLGVPGQAVGSRSTTVAGTVLRWTVGADAVRARADGAFAPVLLAGEATRVLRSDVAGLATQQCRPTTAESWFVAGEGLVGQRASLVITNPTDGTAVVEVDLWDEAGPVPAPGTAGVGVQAGQSVELALDALAAGSASLTARVRTTQGRVVAGMFLRAREGLLPRGVTWVPPSAPRTNGLVPGIPADTAPTVRMFNPGDRDALVELRVLAPTATVEPQRIRVPAGTVVERVVDLTEVLATPADGPRPRRRDQRGEPSRERAPVVAVQWRSDDPVVAAMRLSSGADTDGAGDIAVVTPVTPSRDPVAALVATARPRPRIWLATPATSAATSPPTTGPTSAGDTAATVRVRLLDDRGTLRTERTVVVPPTGGTGVRLGRAAVVVVIPVSGPPVGGVILYRGAATVADPLDPVQTLRVPLLDVAPVVGADPDIRLVPARTSVSAGLAAD